MDKWFSCPTIGADRIAERSAARVAYLTLSGLSGVLELGSVVYATRCGMGLPAVFAYGLTYQLGSVCQHPLGIARWNRELLTAASVAVGLSLMYQQLLWVALLLLAIGLQGLREQALAKAAVSTLQKRIARIAGFILAGGLTPTVVGVVCGGALLISTLRPFRSHHHQNPPPRKLLRPSRLGGVMVIHQMHYFVYSYILPVLFLRIHHLEPLWAVVAFALGWISYSLAPSFLKRFRSVDVVVAGHVAVAATLILMAYNVDNLGPLLALWFASGFGGGTVFGIRRLASEWSTGDSKSDLDAWENVGHVLGVLTAIGLVATGKHSTLLFFAGAAFAAIVATTVTWMKSCQPRSSQVKTGESGSQTKANRW